MNVNGIDPNLQAQATKLLQNKDKVDHGREDLEVLWEYTKQTQELDLGGVSDEDVIAMFDVLDTESNTLKNALALLVNAINDGAIPKNEGSSSSNNNTTVQNRRLHLYQIHLRNRRQRIKMIRL